jgi:hypothetical protein
MKVRNIACIGSLVACLVFTGCASLPKTAVIPTGHWSGDGMFVAGKWAAAGAADGQVVVTQCGEYNTQLLIEKAEVDGVDAARLEITSERGAIASLDGDRTHLVMFLKPRESLADETIAVYEVAKAGLSLDDDPPDVSAVSSDDKTTVTCMYDDGEIVLHVQYMEGWTDTIRFRNNVAYKDGALADKQRLIHWSERLKRQ